MEIETSIVIRTLNEERHLGKLLESIQQQTYKAWEIVLVDSGSTDATLEIARRYTSNIYHIPQKEFTFGRSLNWGCRPATGRYLVFVSAHVDPLTNTWLGNLVRPFDDPSTGMVYGRQRGVATSRVAEERDLQRVFGSTSKILIDEAFGNNGNAAIRKDLWLDQPFDEKLTGLEDIDWARKIQQKGYRVYYAADAAVYHIHEESLRQVYRRVFREGLAYRRIFPGYQFGKVDLVKGLASNVVGDFLYSVRSKTPLKKAAQIPATRIVGHLGLWNGLRYHKTLSKELAVKLQSPQVSRSVVVSAAGQHSVQNSEVPSIGPADVLIQVAYAGVCPTDPELADGLLEKHRNGHTHYPIVPGHEYAGVVVAAGANIRGIHKGDKVVGLIGLDGSYAQYLKVPGQGVHKVPKEVLLKQSALVEPLAVCLHGLRQLGIHEGATACVIGAGPLGNFCAQILKSRGTDVMVVDQDERRLRLLHKYDVNTWQNMESLAGFDYLIDTTGNEEYISRLIADAKPSAKILLVGPPCVDPVDRFLSAPLGDNVDDHKIYSSGAGERGDWEKAIRMIQTYAINLDDHTMNVLNLESYQTAWQGIREQEIFKALLLCSADLEWF
ncbi:MAG: glycosyltransferase [Chloroflexi bacterium]|nr:glycosyltransferase [Chloroflexota bacterium]MDA1219916.1 glycosyltransferase [Chloroflexota bacterium]